MVGGMTPSRMVISENAASMAPAADSVCPIIDLFDDTGSLRMRSPKTVDSDMMLHLVVLGRRCAVGVDVVDPILAEPGIGKCRPHRGDGRRAVGLRAGAVEIVGALAAAGQHAEHFRRRAQARSPAIPAPARPSLRRGQNRRGPSRTVSRPSRARRSASTAPTAARSGSALRPSPNRPHRSTMRGRISPRRMASTPSWMAVAPDAQAVEA
jgi:hypothetical protein